MTLYAGLPSPIHLPECPNENDALAFSGGQFVKRALPLYSLDLQVPLPPFANTAGRSQVTPLTGVRTLVAVISGQSPAACCSDVQKVAGNLNVLNFSILDGKFYQARDPLLGCSTQQGGGSWLVPFGDLAMASGNWDQVILVPIAIDGQAIDAFVNGTCRTLWPVAINRLWQAGLIPDVWFWQQGQSDADVTSATVYRDKLWALVAFMRAYGIGCPFGIIKNSRINGVHANVREGQDLAVSESLGISIAYDSDALGLAYRSTPTDAHWNDAGQVENATQALNWL